MTALEQYIKDINSLNELLNLPFVTYPKTEEECDYYFNLLRSELEPERLFCDGEASQTQVDATLLEIDNIWNELESIIGHSIEQY